jgi:hypothetical protein
MKVSIIFVISIFLLSQIKAQNLPFSKKVQLKLNTKRLKAWKPGQSALYYSSQTGDKTRISPVLKRALKEFGLIHLLTPSGIHLSSLLLFFFLFIKRKIHKYLYFILLCIIMPLTGFYSLKRIIIFHILKCFKLSNQYSFIATFLIDIFIGGYSNSPLSFAFSFLCWGVIIFSKGPRLKLIYNLFLCQFIISYFTNFSINPIAIFINPLFTSIFSLLFPIMSINFWIFDQSPIDSTIINFFYFFKTSLIFLSNTTSILLFIPTSLMLLIPIFHNLKVKYYIYLLLFLPSTLNLLTDKETRGHKDIISPLPHRSETLTIKRNKIVYWDKECKLNWKNEIYSISCKKKPSAMGGLSI